MTRAELFINVVSNQLVTVEYGFNDDGDYYNYNYYS